MPPEQRPPEHVVVPAAAARAVFASAPDFVRPGAAQRRPSVVVPPESIVPPLEDGERDVWLIEWQVAEDAFDVAVGERVRWDVVDADASRLDHLGGRRLVTEERNTYSEELGAGPEQPIAGVVTRIDQVSVRYGPSANGSGQEPIPGSAMQHAARALAPRIPHEGTIVGWVVRIRVD